MAGKRRDEWEEDSQEYSPEQIEALLAFCEVEIESETDTHFIGFCPFHANHYDPAFEMDKTKGLFICFNPSCGESGTAEQFLARLKGMNKFQAMRKMISLGTSSAKPLTEKLEAIRNKPQSLVQFPVEPVERMIRELWEHPKALDYLVKERGLDEATLKHFEVGYSVKRDTVIFPMHDFKGMLVGFVGRSVEGKDFKNSKQLPKKETLWNLHRARRTGGTVIVVESCIDAMRVHQAGYPNVVAILGGNSISEAHIAQLDRYFDTIIIATDFETKRQYPKGQCRRCKNINFPAWEPVKCVGHRPGRDFGRMIAQGVHYKKILWAAYDDFCVYPHDEKDVGGLSDDEIRQCMRNAISNFEYSRWNIEDRDLV